MMFDQENDLRSPQRKKVKLQRTKGRIPFQILTDGQRNIVTSSVLQSVVKKYTVNDVSSNSVGGIVKKVQLNNFMCHGNFEIELNPRINFISGANGSGKSAIQTAIAVGLGGSASKTNRCSTVNGLIKHGCNSGSITITMTNTGLNAYKPETYGQEIKVVRSLTSTSNSSYRIYNQWGKLISNKKQDLDLILYQFKIYPNNPVSILNQDMARNFLSSNKAEHKYAMFKKATLLDEAEVMLSNINTQIKEQRERIDEKELVLEHLDKEIEFMNQKMQMIEKLKEAKERREKLKDELMWAEVYVFREELTKLKDTCSDQEAIKNQFEQKRNELQNEITRKENRITEIKLNLTALENENRSREESIRNHHQEYRNKKTEYHEKCDEYQKISNTIKSKKNIRAQLQASLDEIEKEEIEQKPRKEEIHNKIAHLQEILVERKCEEKTLLEEICRLNNVFNAALDVKKEKERYITELYDEIKENYERISWMKKRFNDLSVYGSWMPDLIKRIEEAVKRGKFKKPPRGPLGRYIEVRDHQWASAIENHLGRPLLTSFFVDNIDDRKQLYEIINQVKPSLSCSKSPIRNRTSQEELKIHCSRFQEEDRTLILPQIEAKYSKHINLYRTLKINDTVVANFLMDFKSIHQVLLIEDKAACRRSMETRQWANNVKIVINRNADSYLEEGRFYSNMHRAEARLLQRSVSDNITFLKEKAAERKKVFREELTEHISIKKNLRTTRREIERLHNESYKCHLEILQTERQIAKLESTIDVEIPCLKTKLEELNSLEVEITELKKQKKIVNEDQERLGDEMFQARKLLNTFNEVDTTFQSVELCLELENLKTDIERLQKRIEILDKNIDARNSEINELRTRIEKTREQAKEQCIQVSKYSLLAEPLENERRSLQDVKDDLSEVAAFIEEAEKTLGMESLRFEKEFLDKKMTHTKFKMTLRELKKLHEKYESMSLDRAKTISNMRDICSEVVFTQFEKVIRSRNYRGKLLFDHKKNKLDILLAPADSGNNFMNTESLSGGEKSVSTVAFLMALWSNMDLPFYSMDEYDVFMDAINRQTITSLLTSFATAQKSSQFIFLTPLDVSLIQPGPDVAVHRIRKIL